MSVIDSIPLPRGIRWPRADGLIQWIVPLGIVAIWQLACVTGFVPTRVLPAPTDVVLAGWKLLLSGELVRNIWVSFWRASIGFLIGGSIGFKFAGANFKITREMGFASSESTAVLDSRAVSYTFHVPAGKVGGIFQKFSDFQMQRRMANGGWENVCGKMTVGENSVVPSEYQ